MFPLFHYNLNMITSCLPQLTFLYGKRRKIQVLYKFPKLPFTTNTEKLSRKLLFTHTHYRSTRSHQVNKGQADCQEGRRGGTSGLRFSSHLPWPDLLIVTLTESPVRLNRWAQTWLSHARHQLCSVMNLELGEPNAICLFTKAYIQPASTPTLHIHSNGIDIAIIKYTMSI